MSRIGKNIVVLKDAKVNVDGSTVKVEGSKGKLELAVPHGLKVESKEEGVEVTRLSESKQNRANHGTIRAHIANMVKGVTEGHKKDLEIQGLGFRCQQQGSKITFNLGFSHPVEYDVPEDVKVAVANQTNISVEGIDVQRVGQVAAEIRALKKVEPYKGKGIRYVGEVVRRKQGKSVTK